MSVLDPLDCVILSIDFGLLGPCSVHPPGVLQLLLSSAVPLYEAELLIKLWLLVIVSLLVMSLCKLSQNAKGHRLLHFQAGALFLGSLTGFLALELLHSECDVLLELEFLLLILDPFRIFDVVLGLVKDFNHLIDVRLLVDLPHCLVEVLLVIDFLPIGELSELDGICVRIEAFLLGFLGREFAGLVAKGICCEL